MEPRNCIRCGKRIPYIRLEALPDTRCCIACSTVEAKTVLDVELDGPLNEDMVRAVKDVPAGE